MTDIREGLCERCHSRPAAHFELTVFGPLDLRETRLCASCQAVVDVTSELPEAELPGSFTHLGPIDFDVLRASIRRSDTEPGADEALDFVARELPRIAAAHGQTLPPDIHDFVVRHSS